MKTRILFTLVCCSLTSILCLSPTFAQTEKGTLLLGGTAGMSFYSQLNENFFNASLSPRIGFFAANRFTVGASLPIGLNISERYESWNIGIGPFARYYFGSGKLIPFVEAEASLNRYRSRYRDWDGSIITTTSYVRSIGLGLGLAYFLTPAVGLESILSYDASRSSTGTRGQLNLNIGFQVYFSRNKD